MIEGVADHMRERIFEMFDDADVDLDVFANQVVKRADLP